MVDEAAGHLGDEEWDGGEEAEHGADEELFGEEADEGEVEGEISMGDEEVLRKKDGDEGDGEHHPDDHGDVFGAEKGGEGHDWKEARESEEEEGEDCGGLELGKGEEEREVSVGGREGVHPALMREIVLKMVLVYWTTVAPSQPPRAMMVKITAKSLTVKERVCS